MSGKPPAALLADSAPSQRAEPQDSDELIRLAVRMGIPRDAFRGKGNGGTGALFLLTDERTAAPVRALVLHIVDGPVNQWEIHVSTDAATWVFRAAFLSAVDALREALEMRATASWRLH